MSIAPPTYAEFIARFPTFATVAEATVQVILDESAAFLSTSSWGKWYPQGVMYDTAHNLSIEQVLGSSINGGQQAAAGPITSSSGAGISASFESPVYAGASASDSWYMKTAYGQRFLRLRNTVIPSAVLST